MAEIRRRTSVAVNVGGVKVGGSNPIVVQSMTNTDTADVTSTVNQVMALAQAGSELVRVTVNTEAAAAAVPKIVDTLNMFGVRVPIIGDFHYNGHLLLKKYPACARALAKYRINPGNVNIGKKHDDNFRTMIEAAIEYGKPVRIGVNWGSLDGALLTRMMDENNLLPEPKDAREVTLDAIVASALLSAEAAERYGLPQRPHHPQRQSQRRAGSDRRLPRPWPRSSDYALHLGLDRSRPGRERHRRHHRRAFRAAAGRHRRHHPRLADAAAEWRPHRRSYRQPADSAVARHPQFHPAGDRLPRLRPHHQHVLPGHGRPDPDLSARADAGLERAVRRAWKTMKVAVMGCIVNGPGESKHANLGISLPGTFEEPVAPVYIDGKLSTTLRGDAIVAEFIGILNRYVDSHYAPVHSEEAGHGLIDAPLLHARRKPAPLLPVVGRSIREAVQAKARYQEAEDWLQDLAQRILMHGRHDGGYRRRRSLESAARFQRADAEERAWNASKRLGVLVKDLDVGLVDFPTLLPRRGSLSLLAHG